MDAQAPMIFIALEQSGFGAAIRQSHWLYPAANVGHIVSLVFFAGAVAVMDVRLLGGFAAIAPAQLIGRARRIAVAALLGMAFTGFLLFAADAGRVVLNTIFQVKVALIVAGLANLVIYEFGARGAIESVGPAGVLPLRARLAGFLSLGIWVAVAACGRAIAYF